MAVPCASCEGYGYTTEPMEYTEYDKNGKPTTKKGTKTVTCKTCSGKGYVG